MLDETTGQLVTPYAIERGERLDMEPASPSGFSGYVLETREPLMINEDVAGEAARRGIEVLITGEAPKSVLFVPLLAGGHAIGVVSLQNVDREHAFTETDERLLVTLAGSLSVALDNARLVHETRQRNAELALINSVQESIAGELDQQAIYDLVGDRVQEVFDAQVVVISMLDEASGLLVSPYVIERGERLEIDPMPVFGFRKHVLEAREPLAISEDWIAEAERYGNPPVLAGEVPKSGLFVPLFAGGRATGVISLQNVDREHAFSDADERLLVTLAGQPQRRARERAPRPRDPPAERRARADQQRPGRDRRRARPAGDLRHRRRQDPGGLRRAGRRHRPLRRGVGAHSLPVHDRARGAHRGRRRMVR